MFLKTITGFILSVCAAVALAAVDVNKAGAEQLTTVKGIGPTTAEKIVLERQKGEFKDWGDFINRVDGVGAAKASAFSDSGLTIDGKPFVAPAKAERPNKADATKASNSPKAATSKPATDAAPARQAADDAAKSTTAQEKKDSK